MRFEKNHSNGTQMQKIKEIVNQMITGIKNGTGLAGFFAGNYQVAIIILKH
jgi:hypothetical protein